MNTPQLEESEKPTSHCGYCHFDYPADKIQKHKREIHSGGFTSTCADWNCEKWRREHTG